MRRRVEATSSCRITYKHGMALGLRKSEMVPAFGAEYRLSFPSAIESFWNLEILIQTDET